VNSFVFKKSRFANIVCLAITAFVFGGCGSGSDSSAPSGRIDISNVSTSVTSVACPANFPNAICGTIDVPLDYRAPSADKIRVGFIRYKARDPKADGKTAIHFVNGGPGSSWTDDNGSEEQFEGFRENAPDRELLLIEPRGVGLFDPLTCPVRLVSLSTEPLTLKKQLETCAQNVGSKGSNYTSANTAHDFALVTRSLGYTQVDLFGVSYGTFLSSIYASLHPERIRTLTLDGALPINSREFQSDNTYKSTRRIINDLCIRSGTCKGDDVWFELGKLVQGLRQSPRILQRQTGETAKLDATALAALTSEPPTITVDENGSRIVYAPVIDSILQASRGNWTNFEKAFLLQEPTPSPNPEGLIHSISCNDYAFAWNRSDSFETKQVKQRAAEAATPASMYLPFTAAEYQQRPSNFLNICALWQPTTPNPAEDPANLKPSWPNTLPILIINGDLDGQTPIESAQTVAAQFKKSTFIRVRNEGHVVTPSNGCVFVKVLEFLTTKGVAKPEECLDTEPKDVVIGQVPEGLAVSSAKLKRFGSNKL
jgi:pimeloyl-ACP methyl ester carboxylesterase